MARMYSKKKGKSGSSKPLEMKEQSWLRYKGKEVEMLIAKLAKEGTKPSQIGIHLRDAYGIPDVRLVTGKKLTAILADKNLLQKFPEDIISLMSRRIAITKHMLENKKDQTAKRGVDITDSKIRRLVKYYKAKGKISKEWNYNPDEIKMYME
jgi:small subunit ribosomal protein S15